MFGDGAANQGQIWEAANMAKLWNLPAILLCENNQYGMGTAVKRSSCNPQYYKQGGVAIPGVKADGMDVLAVKDAVAYCREHASSGKGPIFLELNTYRYHGHSMSDPGISYRDRDEVAQMRANKDCIEQVKARLVESGWATQDDLKAAEKEIRAKVQAEVSKIHVCFGFL
jgi:pyruvate dehydrogenase E1 component alpha subunit